LITKKEKKNQVIPKYKASMDKPEIHKKFYVFKEGYEPPGRDH
jgi:hypothetical protein